MHPGRVVNEADAFPVFGKVWTQVHARPHVKVQRRATHEEAITSDDARESLASRGSVTILLEPLAIPASVIHDHAYGYGYLASSLFYLECIAEFMEEIDLRGLQYLLRRIKEEAQKARELDAGFRIDGRRLAVARDRARKADRKPPRESTRGG
jgi:hypothetical protein